MYLIYNSIPQDLDSFSYDVWLADDWTSHKVKKAINNTHLHREQNRTKVHLKKKNFASSFQAACVLSVTFLGDAWNAAFWVAKLEKEKNAQKKGLLTLCGENTVIEILGMQRRQWIKGGTR